MGLGNWLMPFSASHTRHNRLRSCFFLGGSDSDSEGASASSAGRFEELVADMSVVVNVKEEKKVSKVERYVVAVKVIVGLSEGDVAMRIVK